MTETIGSGYRRLFQIRLLHHYWLDEGGTLFDLIAPQSKREQRLLSYDVRPVLKVAPTAATESALRGLGCLFKGTASGCIAGAPETAAIPDDALFEFAVTVLDPLFYNYTALTLRPGTIRELYYQPEDRIYRYKENVPVLSNLTGASRGAGAARTLFLTREFPGPAADDPAEALFLSGSALLQLTGDQPGAATQQLSPQAANLPVFLHQGDPPPIVPPAGLLGAPARGILLTEEIPDQVFALIRLSALRPDDPDFSLIDGAGGAKGPVFDVRFKSRSTLWQYFDKETGAPVSAESAPLPLTFFGNAGTRQKPSEGVVKAVMSGGKVSRLVSEIFV